MKSYRLQFDCWILILVCVAVWSASSRAQTSPTAGTPTDGSTNVDRSPSTSPRLNLYPSEQLESKAAVPIQLPVQGNPGQAPKSRQVVDLRGGRIALSDTKVHAAQPPAHAQAAPKTASQKSSEWLDLAIPKTLLEQANIQPREMAPRDLAAPIPGATNSIQPSVPSLRMDAQPAQSQSESTPGSSVSAGRPVRSILEPQSSGAGIKDASDSAVGAYVPRVQELNAPIQNGLRDQPLVNRSLVHPDADKKLLNGDPSLSGGDPKVPGQTYSPNQAIPKWYSIEPSQAPDATGHQPSSQTEVAPFSLLPQSAQHQLQHPSQVQEQTFAPQQPPSPIQQNILSLERNPAAGSSDRTNNGQPGSPSDSANSNSKKHLPTFVPPQIAPHVLDPLTCPTGVYLQDFAAPPASRVPTFDPYAASHVYRGKFAVTTQRPLVELWRPLYTSGIFPPAKTWLGVTNPMKPHFMVYGDLRTAVGFNHNAQGKSNVWGNVLNLDMDLQLTSTERIHAFVSPLNRGAQATGLAFNDEIDVINGTNFNFNTLFFEGDAGALLGGARSTYPPFDLPFTFGLIPLVYQNGIWANDALLGAAVAIPARHSKLLKWSNFDATFFWATDNVSTDAFPGRESAADLFGTAWFIDAYEGYIEADYAFVSDTSGSNRGYHNISAAFTRRYFHRLSNSVRVVVNAGQNDLAKNDRTADGMLLLVENSWITAYPNTIVPYMNLFLGQGRPQSLARNGAVGGILNNTGINFETDAITGYSTLDPTGHNTFGLASGINLLGSQFTHQLVLEFAMLQAVGSRALRNAEGDEYGVGVRYQKPLSHNLIFRTDHMAGIRENATNIHGSRFELRWKF